MNIKQFLAMKRRSNGLWIMCMGRQVRQEAELKMRR